MILETNALKENKVNHLLSSTRRNSKKFKKLPHKVKVKVSSRTVA